MHRIVYALCKFAAYASWCLFGIGFLKLDYRRRILWALLYGCIRLCMGMLFGALIFALGTLSFIGLYSLSHRISGLFASVLVYLLVYIPIRWLEWSLLEFFMNKRCRGFKRLFFGGTLRAVLCRAGGIVVSCIADIPIIVFLGGGLPLGRFMC